MINNIKILSVAYIVALGVLTSIIYMLVFSVPEVPVMKNTWWGRKKEGIDDITIRPFKIAVSPNEITDLQQRLNSTRIKMLSPLEGMQHEYGVNTKLISKFVKYWATKYNWAEREKYLNQYPQYKTQIQGLQIHFVHVKPKSVTTQAVIPILLLHGWPSSVQEFYSIIPLLTTPKMDKNFVFEVILPSLPGFGFSEAASKPGCGAAEMAVIFHNLMKRLGYNSYYVHGGDWGAGIASYMSILYPSEVLGMHKNLCISQTKIAVLKTLWLHFTLLFDAEKAHQLKVYPLSSQFNSFILETGYFHIQATKPDTIGVTLTDSPVGLAAYILEKFITLTNPEGKYQEDGGLTAKFSKEDLLDNIMIYWITGSMTTAMRIYAESTSKAQRDLGLSTIPITVPSACAKFPHEFITQSDNILSSRYTNLVHSKEYSRGGHFIALEEPNLLAEDIWTAISTMRLKDVAVVSA